MKSALPILFLLWLCGTFPGVALAAECPSIYGIHDHEFNVSTYLDHITPPAGGGWITATVAIGHNPSDTGGVDFSNLAGQGNTVICRINNGYYPSGTIPTPADYTNFAQRCANFVTNSRGCNLWVIGNELNISGEWPINNGRHAYVTPQSYGACFRLVYEAIKAVRPDDRVIVQALAPWAGPYSAGSLNGVPHDAVPINWVQYMNQMLTGIAATGPLDGIALHINSRGYARTDIHSASRVTANGQQLFFSFYVYKDWVERGIPRNLYGLPLYATECNGYYFWKGGHAENPAKHYEPGWVQEIYAEINRYNEYAIASGRPVFRCVNFYRWCASCDGWNIDGGSNPYRSQILSDLDDAVSRNYRWPVEATVRPTLVSTGAIWKYKDDGSNLGTSWREPIYAATTWPSGPAQLGYGDGDETTLVSFGPVSATKHITTYFRRTFVVGDRSFFTNLNLRLLRDDGAAVYLNGTEIYRSNLPGGLLSHTTLALAAVTGGDENTNYYTAPVSVSLLVDGTNVLAAEVHQSSGDSSDLSFDLELSGQGNQRPAVAILSPADGSVQALQTNLMVQVTSNDRDGSVSRVELLADGVKIGEDTTSPFQFLWTNPPAGNHTLVAIAVDNGGLATTSAPVRLGLHPALIAKGTTWKFLDNGSNAGIAWRETDFNDMGWASGPAELGYGDGDEATVVSFGPNSANKYITTYFRHTFPVANPSALDGLVLRLRRDDGAVAYLNGAEVLRSNMPPTGPILFTTTASSSVADADEQMYFATSVSTASLRTGANVMAAEIHQANGSSSDLSFDLELLGVPGSIPQLSIARQGAAVTLSWLASIGGFHLEASPAWGAPWMTVGASPIVSNEVQYVTLPVEEGATFYRLAR